jgi:hypothetical protein
MAKHAKFIWRVNSEPNMKGATLAMFVNNKQPYERKDHETVVPAIFWGILSA